jgi:peptide-N4-(N-acetyl-beta-glucosaminyl)asparagine amidase
MAGQPPPLPTRLPPPPPQQHTIRRRPTAQELAHNFRRVLSTKRMNELSREAVSREPSPVPLREYPVAEHAPPPSYKSLRNIPLIPTAPTDARSIRFRSMLHTLSNIPLNWENPGLLDEALLSVPLEQIYAEAEENSQVYQAEAESLGPRHQPLWKYQDCVIRALLKWFKGSFFSWVNNPPCSVCGCPTLAVGMAAPFDEEKACGANTVELYQCSAGECASYERFPRYNDAFVLMTTRRGRVGEWSNCFGMLCRAMDVRVRWVWNSEDHVLIEYYSVHRQRWVHVDPTEGHFDRPTLYTEGE